MTSEPIRLAVGTLLAPQGGSEHATDRRRAAALLLEHPDEGHAAVTQALAGASASESVTALIQLLPEFERPEDVPLLAEMLTHASDPRAIVAAQALAAHPHPDALAALLDALDGPPHAAVYAAQALAQRGDRAARPHLEALAERPAAPDWVRQAARESLRTLG